MLILELIYADGYGIYTSMMPNNSKHMHEEVRYKIHTCVLKGNYIYSREYKLFNIARNRVQIKKNFRIVGL
jgi:hypothetical protein